MSKINVDSNRDYRQTLLTGITHSSCYGVKARKNEKVYARIDGSSVEVWQVLKLFLLGYNKKKILRHFSWMLDYQYDNVMRYVLFNYAEIIQDIRDNESSNVFYKHLT